MRRYLAVLGPGVVLTLLAMPQKCTATLALTGLVEYHTNPDGNYPGGWSDRWNTLPDLSIWNLWVARDHVQGAFINGPDNSQAGISIPLSDGDYTFCIFGEAPDNHAPFPFWGLNLFFNGQTQTPSISAFGPLVVPGGDAPWFLSDSGRYTLALDGNTPVPGAGVLSFAQEDTTVSLTRYWWSHPAVESLDRVNDYTLGASTVSDFVGALSLHVETRGTAVPEPPSFTLLVVALATGGALKLRRRRK